MCIGAELDPATDGKLPVDVVEMRLHSGFADEESNGDLLVAPACADQPNDLRFPPGQSVHGWHLPVSLMRGQEPDYLTV